MEVDSTLWIKFVLIKIRMAGKWVGQEWEEWKNFLVLRIKPILYCRNLVYSKLLYFRVSLPWGDFVCDKFSAVAFKNSRWSYPPTHSVVRIQKSLVIKTLTDSFARRSSAVPRSGIAWTSYTLLRSSIKRTIFCSAWLASPKNWKQNTN